MGTYLLHALDSEEEDCARVACGIISDIATALQELVEEYLTSFVPELLKVLRSNQRSRVSKLHALQSLGDLAVYAPIKYCTLYLKDTLEVLRQAGEISVSAIDTSEDEELEQYMIELKTNVLNCYCTVIGSAKECNQQQEILNSSTVIFSFLQRCLNNEAHGVAIFVLVAGLIGDLCDCLGAQVAQLCQQPWVGQLLKYLQS